MYTLLEWYVYSYLVSEVRCNFLIRFMPYNINISKLNSGEQSSSGVKTHSRDLRPGLKFQPYYTMKF